MSTETTQTASEETAQGFTDRLRTTVRDRYEQAKHQLVTVEKEVESRVQRFEKSAKVVPQQVRAAFEAWVTQVSARIKHALSLASQKEIAELAARVEALAAKLEALTQPTLVAEPASEAEAAAPVAEVAEEKSNKVKKTNGNKRR